MNKSIAFKMPQQKTKAADVWVGDGVESHLKPVAIEGSAATPGPVIIKRLTVEVPLDLHTRIKIQCAERGKLMADEVRRLLETEFPAEAVKSQM